MILAILEYRALAESVEQLARDKEQSAPFFEKEIPGLVDKTWAQNDETGRGTSVYHFEDRQSADAWFDSDRQREFRRVNGASIDFYEVGMVAVRSALKTDARQE